MEREFRPRDKLPSRDGASTRRWSTTNKGPLLSFRRKPPLRPRMLRTPVPGCTSRNLLRACRPRGLRRSQKRGKAGFFSFHLAPAQSKMSIYFQNEKNTFRLLHLLPLISKVLDLSRSISWHQCDSHASSRSYFRSRSS